MKYIDVTLRDGGHQHGFNWPLEFVKRYLESLNLFPEIGLPNSLGQIQRLEEPGRPDLKQSNRGPGTGLRISVPVINITKTRLNDPFTWLLGTNEQPGDYRSSGCAACHVFMQMTGTLGIPAHMQNMAIPA